MRPFRLLATFAAVLFLFLTTSAQAQWVLAAHAAKNRINHMTQKSDNGGYDVATVMLDADPSKVYDKTVEQLKTHPELTITQQDKSTGTIQIKKGDQVLGFQIYALGDKLTQMVVASGAGQSKETEQTSTVVQSIMRVCNEFGVTCTVQSQ